MSEQGELEPLPVLLTAQEVAAKLRISVHALHQMRHKGQGPKGWISGRRLVYDVEEVRRYIKEQARLAK